MNRRRSGPWKAIDATGDVVGKPCIECKLVIAERERVVEIRNYAARCFTHLRCFVPETLR